MEMKPATIVAIIFILVVLILPVFFLNLNDLENNGNTGGPDDVPANAPHPHKYPPEMQRELDRVRAENKPVNPPSEPSPPANTPPSNEPPPVN